MQKDTIGGKETNKTFDKQQKRYPVEGNNEYFVENK